MATKTKKSSKPTITKAVIHVPSKPANAKVEIAFTAKESKAIAALTVFGTEAQQTLDRLDKLGGVFKSAYEALASLPREKWDAALTQAKVPVTSSYYSSLKRAASDPKAAFKALETAGNVHGAIKLLPHQPTKSGKKTGRPEKSEADRTKEKALKAVAFLCQTYDLADIHKMIDKHYAKFDKSASEKEIQTN